MYDARSIGFQYKQLDYCERDADFEESAKNWLKYLPMAMNPEVAEESGYFWAVKEIILWEGSDVSFGANELTPLLGLKSGSKGIIEKQLFDKLDICKGLLSDGKLSDGGFHRLEMEMKQIKSYISTLTEQQPFKKGTSKSPSRQSKDTSGIEFIKAMVGLKS